MRPIEAVAALLALLLLTSPALAAPRFTASVEGTGPDVILIPGLASSTAIWEATAGRLQRTHRVHRIQVAGFAGAPVDGNGDGPIVAPLAEDIAAYIADNKLVQPAIIGHSLGGEVGLMLAARHPARVGRVMAVDALPFAALINDPAATPDTFRNRAAAARDALLYADEAGLAAQAGASVTRMVRTPARRAQVAQDSATSDRSVVARAMFELMTTDLRSELARIAVPLTVVYAYDTSYGVPPSHVDRLFRSAYAAAPAARLQRIDRSRHFIMLDRPDVLAEAIDAFLAPTLAAD